RPDERTPGFDKKKRNNGLEIIPPKQVNRISDTGYTLLEQFRNNGYHTSWFGKVHGTNTQGANFDVGVRATPFIEGKVDGKRVRSGYYALKDDKDGWKFMNRHLKDYAEPYSRQYIEEVLVPIANGNDPSVLIGQPKHMTDALGDAAVDYIAERASAKKPFFLYFPFHAPHTPTVSRADLSAKYKKKQSVDTRHTDPEYAGMVELVDQNIRKVLNALEDPNGDGNISDSIVSNTLVIFTSDNGGTPSGRRQSDAINAPLRGIKGSYFEGGVRVPYIARWPGVIQPGSISKEIIHCIDAYPTLAEIANIPLPRPQVHKLDGVSFAPILMGKAKELKRDSLYWHFPGYMDSRQIPNSVHVTKLDGEVYKLYYYYEDKRYELFNLTDDISEQNNLLRTPELREAQVIAKNMNTRLLTWLKTLNAPTGTSVNNKRVVPYPPVD
ncbi:MAG: sulfatase-like hydrolase/transferase, partial [Opitutales bacterium]